MTPCERAIMSRIKEAFAYKITHDEWAFILHSLTLG
jgi:hypothetical protein